MADKRFVVTTHPTIVAKSLTKTEAPVEDILSKLSPDFRGNNNNIPRTDLLLIFLMLLRFIDCTTENSGQRLDNVN